MGEPTRAPSGDDRSGQEGQEVLLPPDRLQVDPGSYRHWQVRIEPPLATVVMAVDPEGGLLPGYELKLNSYDLGVDLELADIVERLRFEHPEVKAVVLTSALDRVFCAGANIQMLASATHHLKVNFCKFTNETRAAMEEASARSGQVWLAAVNGTAAGGGYELALACDEILLVDDRSSAVALPEVPLLGVLPGTGGLTRLVDKRYVRRDLADVLCTKVEGVKGRQAVEWGLVDEAVPRSRFEERVRERALERAAASDRPDGEAGVSLAPVQWTPTPEGWRGAHVAVRLDRATRSAWVVLEGPEGPLPEDLAGLKAQGSRCWLLAARRELDDALVRLRLLEPTLGTWVLVTRGDPEAVLAADALLEAHGSDWLVREIRLGWGRTLRRLELSARTLVALVDAGSCFAGTLAELALVADRSFMLEGPDGEQPAPTLTLGPANDGWYETTTGTSRLALRFLGHPEALARARSLFGQPLAAKEAAEAGLVTHTPDELDFADEVRVFLEERASFSPDALTGMEANLRFAGPETMDSKVFGRLSAWQNWIFQRPNAVGPEGALRRYGSGARPSYDWGRV
ncbi:2,3-epoxybenzoyl-CoA dihydrolase [Aciditerrimonas ferrireducens]|uniref:2,3-epoxybenzoyl-CoA dihydrolase n=1 Tax=Aciditerrimonas ferrireducens TaxID=667306 RepID=UPI0020037063|nr:2,3-epoxybenzoyl-CoA dihydrolase [Aciditerrimonas ferrireducens]MCK4177657.1 2,3-epoxybenzoyl-CoA dihydrolase [Aciditerrimonas ferrireducens]